MAETGSPIDGNRIADCVARFRSARPHVHCITNAVAQHFTANVLLAAGATPSMTIAEAEIVSFVEMADALLINLGTMDSERTAAAHLAVATASRLSKPWALDPVFVQASPTRLELARKLLAAGPTVIRCNEGEGRALFGDGFSVETINQHAQTTSTTIALTGKIDHVSDGHSVLHLANGSAMMDRITAMGCALNALMAGFAAVEENRLLAGASALALYGLAGEQAEHLCDGPGTFVPHFLDELANLDPTHFKQGVRLT